MNTTVGTSFEMRYTPAVHAGHTTHMNGFKLTINI